jgi:uncharacterized protein YqeY
MPEETLKNRITDDLKDAMRAKDKARLRTLRSLRSALMEKEIGEREGGEGTLADEQELQVVRKQAKQRRESIEQYEDAGRDDLAQKEREELDVLDEYLPRQLSESEIEDVVDEIIEETGASSMADMGSVMGPAMQRLRGRADGEQVQQVARRKLSG